MKGDKERKKMKLGEKSEFEFCEVCKLNHNQGRRHNFFPRHVNSLSSLFNRFHQKLCDIKKSLKNPSLHLPAQSSHNRLWCIFCDTDIDNHGSSFASGNAIKHLASDDHLKNLKHFLWKYGGGMEKVASFRITEAELAEWEKKCKVLESEAASSSGRCDGTLHGQSNDIQPNYEIMTNFDKNNIHFFESSLSNNVMPLQYNTNENYQVYHSDISGAGTVGPFQHSVASPMPLASKHGLNTWDSTYMGHGSEGSLLSSARNFLPDGVVRSGVHKNQSVANGKSIMEGYQNFTHISSVNLEDAKGNVHSGAPPPWLEGIEAHSLNGQQGGPSMNISEKNSRKTSKLNPKRVGAAWAEKRKLELEMEKRGEVIANDYEADWLPKFGRVWQSGSRKESMKEFKKQKLNIPKAETQAETEIKISPYISKRMRRDTNEVYSESVRKSADIS